MQKEGKKPAWCFLSLIGGGSSDNSGQSPDEGNQINQSSKRKSVRRTKRAGKHAGENKWFWLSL